MPVTGSRTDPYLGSHFFVEIDGIDHGGFTECSGLQAETEVTDYVEGGNNGFVHKLPGRTKFSNITLKWGSTDSTALWEWYLNVTRGQVERKDVSVVLYNSEQEEVRRWNLREAYPVKWIGPAFTAATPAVAIETLEITHHGFEVE
ncbi:MAG: phage tail protein [Anaerolineales bacterium]|nr:phage tail protein [Anaerolineales bacterium]